MSHRIEFYMRVSALSPSLQRYSHFCCVSNGSGAMRQNVHLLYGCQKKSLFRILSLRSKILEVIILWALSLYYSESCDNFQSDAKNFIALLSILFEILLVEKIKKSVVRTSGNLLYGHLGFLKSLGILCV